MSNSGWRLLDVRHFSDDEWLTQQQEVEKARVDLEQRFFSIQLLEEEKLEIQLKSLFDKMERECFKNFDEQFVPNYRNKSMKDLVFDMNVIRFQPSFDFLYSRNFRFKRFKLPTNLKNNLLKAGTAPVDSVNIVSKVDSQEFMDLFDDSSNKSYKRGGQTVFKIFKINTNFKIIDERAVALLHNRQLELSNNISAHISSRIKFEILEGMRNAESIPEIRDRITNVWDSPVEVVIQPRFDKTGSLLQQGYTYQIKNDVWATITARTEISKAMSIGKLDGYRQTGVVGEVEFSISNDERVCPICSSLDGSRYTLDVADGIIPAHAQCRCTWIPILTKTINVSAIETAQRNIQNLYQIDLQ